MTRSTNHRIKKKKVKKVFSKEAQPKEALESLARKKNLLLGYEHAEVVLRARQEKYRGKKMFERYVNSREFLS